MIDLKALKPNKVSVNWHSQSISIIAPPKAGKSTFMFDLLGKEALFLATENGHEAIPNIMSQRVHSVSDIKEVLFQLEDMVDNNECPFKCIVIDTTDNLQTLIEKYVMAQLNISDMGGAPHGKAYVEFDKVLKGILAQIANMGLGVHFIGHVKLKKVQDKINKVEYEKYVPSISERMQKIILSDCYFMPFIFTKLDEQGNEHRMMAFRDTTQWLSGSIN